MKFFVPPIEDVDEALKVYDASINYLESKGESITRNYRIYSVEISIDNAVKTFVVGEKDLLIDELLVFIFENINDFIFCTTNFEHGGGNFHKLSKENPYKVEYFNKMEYVYKDWAYILNNFNNHIVKHPKNHPETVYKYYSNSYLNREAIINNYLFCSHPYHLNDPMDFSSLLWDFSGMTDSRYSEFFEFYNLPMAVLFNDDKADKFKYIKTKFWEIHTERSGIISLSDSDLNTLMWAHYSSENGFSVEFKIEKLIHEIRHYNRNVKNYVFMPVQYVDNIEMIDFCSKDFKSPDIPYLYALNIKKNDWIYENEWRLVCYSDNLGIPFSLIKPEPDKQGKIERKIFYGKDTVNSIVLGQRFICGKNTEEIVGNNTYLIKDTEEKPTHIEFINYLFENYNDRLFICDNFDPNESFKRKKVKISFEKIDDKTFKINR